MTKLRMLVFVAAAGSVMAGCGRTAPPAAKPTGAVLAEIDAQANPCQNFYQYACGNWIAKNPIPADQAEWGTFSQLAERNREALHQILEDARTNSGQKDALTQEVGDYYAACMNQGAIDAGGIKPLQSELDLLASVQTPEELAGEVARLQLNGVNALFGFGSDQDFKDANQEIAEADQGGLGLPDRDYYTKGDAKSAALRQQYVAHVKKMMELLGDAPAHAAAEAKTVMRIESALARGSMTNVSRRDPNQDYHKMSVAQLEALAPAFGWSAFFAGAGAPSFGTINVVAPGFFRAMNAELKAAPLADWKTYLRWQLVHAAAPALPQPFVDAEFAFFGTALTGQKEQRARWKRCVSSTDQHLGEALGQLYVKSAFTPQAKAHMQALVANLEAALGQDIGGLSWMSAPTKRQAKVKLAAIVNKIGYPDQWRDYSSIVISRDNYYTDLRRTEAFESHRELNKIGKPVDRSEWSMTPPTVNAYYTPQFNQIVFPAGILQPPFFDLKRDDASNYGAIGVVIGHEISHGFDDSGRQFDPQGNLRDWWTAADAKAFQQRAACLVEEYNGFSPVAGVKVNGKLTLGENLGDSGGARIAYMAMETALAGLPDETIDGYNRAQRFFLGYGQVWCENVRPEAARMLAATDPHAPGEFRVNGIVSNMAEFAQAFHCGPQDAMTAKANACRVW
ncbi:MAG: M13 family metallopeptidase [Terriglobales bacterium]